MIISLIFYYSLIPLPGLIEEIFIFDPTKFLLHLLTYFVLGSLVFSIRKRFIESFLAAGFYGFVVELTQLFVPGRSFSPFDLLANFVGSGIGSCLAYKLEGNKILNHFFKEKLVKK